MNNYGRGCNSNYNQNYNQNYAWNNTQNYRQNNTQEYTCKNHVHEVSGSTATVQECDDCHSHRFATVSGDAIRSGDSHVHEVKFCTDYADGHQHEYCDKTSCAIEVGNGKHVHFLKDVTGREDGHVHQFQTATFIDSPTDFKDCE